MMFISQYLMDFKVLKIPFRSLQFYEIEKASEEKVETLYRREKLPKVTAVKWQN